MPRISLPPFLKKLQSVTDAVDERIAHWSEDGTSFIIEKSDDFEEALSQFFKGSLLTFIRQLHFYGFRKVDMKGERWSFSHRCFRKDLPHLIYEIRRKTRTETNDGVASHSEVQALRDHVGKLNEVIEQMKTELKETKEELALIRQDFKRDHMRAFSSEFDPFPTLSNGGDLMPSSKKSKLSSIPDYEITNKKKLADDDSVKLEPIDELSMDAFSDSIDNFASFLPFTDSAYESMNLNGGMVI